MDVVPLAFSHVSAIHPSIEQGVRAETVPIERISSIIAPLVPYGATDPNKNRCIEINILVFKEGSTDVSLLLQQSYDYG